METDLDLLTATDSFSGLPTIFQMEDLVSDASLRAETPDHPFGKWSVLQKLLLRRMSGRKRPKRSNLAAVWLDLGDASVYQVPSIYIG